MRNQTSLPDDFLQSLSEFEPAYLAHDDPIRQSGFSGGAVRWRAEREPILQAVDGDGDLLDLGCANGYLLECLVDWGRARGVTLVPYGVDQGTALIARAHQRLPQYADHFYVANVWDWQPPRRFRSVYALYDCVPLEYLGAYVRRLVTQIVAPGGRLIMGAYGSRSRGEPPFDIAGFLHNADYTLAGDAWGGDPPFTRFAWIDVSR